MTTLGFIILRYVNSQLTNTYWITCYKKIREFYPENEILIIDDNSDRKFLTSEELYKTHIINSEFPKREELLPYYYYLQKKYFDLAVIIHDSVFIQKKMDFSVDSYRIIWTFEHDWDQIEDETRMISLFNDTELESFYKQKNLWKGCFGCMTVISHEFLSQLNKKYDLSLLLPIVQTRFNRCSLERVLACLLQKERLTTSLLGNIHAYCRWGISINEIHLNPHLPLLKVWTGK